MPGTPVTDIRTQTHGSTAVVAVAGEIDLSSVDAVWDSLANALASESQTVVLDLGEVSFCDSSGIRAVLGANRRAGELGVRFVAIRPRAGAWRGFEILRVDRHVEFARSLEAVRRRAGHPHAA